MLVVGYDGCKRTTLDAARPAPIDTTVTITLSRAWGMRRRLCAVLTGSSHGASFAKKHFVIDPLQRQACCNKPLPNVATPNADMTFASRGRRLC
jgi:hypothetical protein